MSTGTGPRPSPPKPAAQPVTDLAEVLPDIQAASVVVPNAYHYEVAKPLLDAGIHTLLEKPLTNTVAEADELIALAADRGVVLQSGHLERFNPAVRVLRERTGTPLFIEAHRLSGFKNRATDVDVVLDLMIHDIDIVLSVVESAAGGNPRLGPAGAHSQPGHRQRPAHLCRRLHGEPHRQPDLPEGHAQDPHLPGRHLHLGRLRQAGKRHRHQRARRRSRTPGRARDCCSMDRRTISARRFSRSCGRSGVSSPSR